MKLNGKVYLSKKKVSDLIENLLLDVELSNIDDINPDLGDLNSNDIDSVLDLLTRLKNQIYAMYDNETYISNKVLSEEIEEMLYDKTKQDVALYRYGAYGVKSRASDDAVKRFAFNTIANSLKNKINNLKSNI